MYARSACASCAVSSSLILTRSPIDTSPSSLPSSITGRCRKRRSVISPSASSTDIASCPTTMLQVIAASTGRRSRSRSPSANRCTTSRSVKMPTAQPSPSGTSTAPTFSACMVRIASATLDLADTATTRLPLAASTSLSFIAVSSPRLAQDLPDVVARTQIGDELLQIRTERVARRHHAERLAVLHHRHVPEFAFVHQVERMPERPVGRDGARIRRHDLGQAGLRRVAALGEHAEQRVALGEDAGQPAALRDQQRADAVALHQLRRRRDARFGAGGNRFLLPYDAADRSFFHDTPPRASTLLSARRIALQIFFCTAKISIKIFPCARNISFPWATAASTASPIPSGAITTIRTSWCACTVLRATAAISTSSPKRSLRTAAWCAWTSSDGGTATGWTTSPNTRFPPTWPTRRRCWRG